MTNEYTKFLENYKNLFKQYKKKTGKTPVQDGELTDGFQKFKRNIEDDEIWDEWLKVEDN